MCFLFCFSLKLWSLCFIKTEEVVRCEIVNILIIKLSIGYDCGTADGVAGLKFDSAAKAWAKANGCTADGEFTKGGKSWKTILKVDTTSTSNSKPLDITTTKGYVYNGVNYSLVFNPTYYANSYSDLKRHFGDDATKLFQHYINFGIQEGRQAISTFNVKIYKLSNPDLQVAFGEKDGYNPYVLHYLQYGHKENRKTV